MISHTKTEAIGFRYNLAFTQATVSARQTNNTTTFQQTARGSLLYDASSKYVQAGIENTVGRSGIVIQPFLDYNGNGVKDNDEPKVTGLNLHVNGRFIKRSGRDSSIRILGLEPYSKYLIELDPGSFENISWQLKIHTLNVVTEPNRIKAIPIPVSIVGEVSGTVNLKTDKGVKGAGRIIVCVYKNDSTLVTKILTEPDGYFSYLGLAPGSYILQIDSNQMSKLNMQSSSSIPFTIEANKDGDVKDGFEFLLTAKEKQE